MKSSIIAVFVAFSLFLIYPTPASAASSISTDRYLLFTNRTFWRTAFSARHTFTDGFTANLSDLQLKVAKFAGLKPIPVKKFNILDEEGEATPEASPTPQMVPSQSVSWGVRAMLSDTTLKETSGGEGITVAVIDTGIDTDHPDLQARIDGCFDLTDVEESFVEDSCEDLNGHGTHMAGIIVADGGPDGEGLYGFAPQASISAYRACNRDGICFSDDIAIAMQSAVDSGAQIIVLGIGGESASSFINDALDYADEHDVLVIAAAGNDGPYEDSVDWPAQNPIAVSVGALDNKNIPAEFSSRGDVEFAAPGVNIESTFRDGGYAILSGTSMAAPHIAGLAALLWQSDSEHPAEATRELLHKISFDLKPEGKDAASGFGLPLLTAK